LILEGSEVLVRTVEPGDRNFVISTWLRSAKDASKMSKDKFFSFTRPQVERDIDNGMVVVACDAEVPGTIYGWACYRDGVLRWAYTVYDLRNRGVFSFLKAEYEKAEEQAAAA